MAPIALLGPLGHFEERQQPVAAHIEEIVTDLLERRIAAIARSGAEPGRNLHCMHQTHAQDADVEIDGHLHVVGVERQMVHAVVADLGIRMSVAAVLEIGVGHGTLPGRCISGHYEPVRAKMAPSVCSTIQADILTFELCAGRLSYRTGVC